MSLGFKFSEKGTKIWKNLPIIFWRYKKLVHVVLHVILGWYYYTLEWIFFIYFFNWQTEKKSVLHQMRSLFTYYHNKFLSHNIVTSSQINVWKYHPDNMKRFKLGEFFNVWGFLRIYDFQNKNTHQNDKPYIFFQ